MIQSLAQRNLLLVSAGVKLLAWALVTVGIASLLAGVLGAERCRRVARWLLRVRSVGPGLVCAVVVTTFPCRVAAQHADSNGLQEIRLRNGAEVTLISLQRVEFPEGNPGLAVFYHSKAGIGSPEMKDEIRWVWIWLAPRLRESRLYHGIVNASSELPRKDGASVRGYSQRGCLTDDGRTIWLDIDGNRSKKDHDHEAGKSCGQAER